MIPQVFQTPFGPTGSDGLKLWTILFLWNKPPSAESAPVPLWELILCHILKWTVFLITLSATLLAAIGSVWVLIHPFTGVALGARVLVAAVILAFSLVSGWITFRVAREPIARTRKPLPSGGLFNPSLAHSAQQRELLARAAQELAQGRFGEAEKLCDELIASLPDINSAVYANLLLAKLDCTLKQNDFERAEKTCLDFINHDVAIQQKIRILDGFACRLLYQPSSPLLAQAEKFVRLALELAPGTLTLLGTLGGVLAEEGKFAEAEPLLRECLDRSPAMHDQGISSFYLGVVKLGTGNAKEAKRLIKRGMLMYPEPWLLAKAKIKLTKLNDRSQRSVAACLPNG